MGLTPKQQRFVSEYAVDLNATQAAIRAGYSEHTAKQQGSRLLSNVDVRQALAPTQQKTAERIQKTADDIARFHWSVIEDEDAPLSDRLRASSLEMRRFAEYSEKTDARILTANIPIPEGTTLEDLRALRDGLRGDGQ